MVGFICNIFYLTFLLLGFITLPLSTVCKIITQLKMKWSVNELEFYLQLTYSCRFCVYSTGSCTSLVFQESWGEVVWFSHNFNQSLWYMNELSLYQVIRSWSAECRGHVSIHFIVILWSKTMKLYFLVSEHRFFLKTGMPMHVSLGILGSATVVVNSSTNSFCTLQ